MSRPYSDKAVLSPGSFGLAALFDAIDRHVVRPALARHRQRVARRELSALDDAQLADIGLSRGEIDSALSACRRAPFSHRA